MITVTVKSSEIERNKQHIWFKVIFHNRKHGLLTRFFDINSKTEMILIGNLMVACNINESMTIKEVINSIAGKKLKILYREMDGNKIPEHFAPYIASK